MKLVIIFGPQAVGKMTVGQQLAKITGLKLFHNHMTIDLVAEFFDLGNPEAWRLVNLFRQEIFESVSKSDVSGMIFTYVWAFDMDEDGDYLQQLTELFQGQGAEVCWVELEADYDVRHGRNSTPNRLEHKSTKRNLEQSEWIFTDLEAKHRLNSLPGEITHENYIRIENTSLPPWRVAQMIKEHFGL